MARSQDTRFTLVEDAATLLRMLPEANEIVWPTDGGDREAVDEALKWLSDWLPAAKASWRRHKRELREAAARRGSDGLRAPVS